ncbi:MAG TPA: 30S ribosome-binding factor RbfA [Capsulimonadaceae bacterium]|nr:30S ribosome-binding factor RbfA [Capsulimonadaceae bacterium]
MSATRKQRLAEALRAELYEVIRREMRDPRLSEGLLSITDVDVSPDLKYATVYVSVLGDDHAKTDILRVLKGAAGVLRAELGRRKAFKSVPELTFRYDESIERGARVFSLIEQATQEDEARHPDEEPEAQAG